MYCFLLIESCPTIAHVVHRAHLKPFLASVLRRMHRWLADKTTASQVQRTDVSTEQRRALFSTAALAMVIRNAAFALWCGECSHCFSPSGNTNVFNIPTKSPTQSWGVKSECLTTASMTIDVDIPRAIKACPGVTSWSWSNSIISKLPVRQDSYFTVGICCQPSVGRLNLFA